MVATGEHIICVGGGTDWQGLRCVLVVVMGHEGIATSTVVPAVTREVLLLVWWW